MPDVVPSKAMPSTVSKRRLNRIQIVQQIIDRIHAERYLEIGVAEGTCFLNIQAPEKIGVDPHFNLPLKRILPALFSNSCNFKNRYYRMTSDQFFESQAKTIAQKKLDMVFIDGLHTYEQSRRDAENSLRFLSPRGVIAMHDCNPWDEVVGAKSKEEARQLPGWKKQWCGEVWKTIVHLRATRNDLEVYVLDTDCGVAILRKTTQSIAPLDVNPAEIAGLSYQALEDHRGEWLNLKPPTFFDDFLATLHSTAPSKKNRAISP